MTLFLLDIVYQSADITLKGPLLLRMYGMVGALCQLERRGTPASWVFQCPRTAIERVLRWRIEGNPLLTEGTVVVERPWPRTNSGNRPKSVMKRY